MMWPKPWLRPWPMGPGLQKKTEGIWDLPGKHCIEENTRMHYAIHSVLDCILARVAP